MSALYYQNRFPDTPSPQLYRGTLGWYPATTEGVQPPPARGTNLHTAGTFYRPVFLAGPAPTVQYPIPIPLALWQPNRRPLQKRGFDKPHFTGDLSLLGRR